MIQTNITRNLANTTSPGMNNEILFAPKSWFLTIAAPPTSGTAWGEKGLITGDHIFNTTSPAQGFVTLYSTPRSAELTIKMVGEIDSQGIDSVLEGIVPGDNPAIFDLMAEPDEYIVLAKPLDCEVDYYFQLGQGCSGALFSDAEYKSGKGGGEGRNGTVIRFNTYGSKVLRYEGIVALAIQP